MSEKIRGQYCIEYAQGLEQRLDSRVERFSGVFTRKHIPLDEGYPQTSLGAKDGSDGAARAASNHDNVVLRHL